MKRVSLNHWYVKDNKLEISLMWFFVSIDVKSNGCFLKVVEDGINETSFYFSNLEEAIDFTEKFIASCKDIELIKETYKIINQGGSKDVMLYPEEVDQALLEYFGEGRDYRISIKEELSMEDNKPKIDFYLIEHLKYGDVEENVKTLLTNEDLLKAFNKYLEDINCEAKDFKYMGGIHHVGYYFDEDTPYYEGVILTADKKEKVLTK